MLQREGNKNKSSRSIVLQNSMNHCYVLVLLLIVSAVTLGCTTAPVSESCPVTTVSDLLPAQNISTYQPVSFSSNLGSDFYRVLLENDSQLLSVIRTGIVADYNSTSVPGASMNILVIEFGDPASAETAVSILQDAVINTISANSTAQAEKIDRNNISYSSLHITGITTPSGVEFYQEFVFWHVHQYTVMNKLTTPDIGQDPHGEMLKFIDEMAYLCSP
ncbi:MAG: hypothetical protein LUO93_00800 [Methanomicrobiales archaeon]|nr:hypothetical protein [Methanomicrobiales archaeon]